MDSFLSSVNTIVALTLTFAGGCIWLGTIYASHKALQNDVKDLSEKFSALDKKMDRIINLLIDKIGKHEVGFGD